MQKHGVPTRLASELRSKYIGAIKAVEEHYSALSSAIPIIPTKVSPIPRYFLIESLEQSSTWLLWIVYEVGIANQEFILGDRVSGARYIDGAELAHSEDIFEKLVYSVANE